MSSSSPSSAPLPQYSSLPPPSSSNSTAAKPVFYPRRPWPEFWAFNSSFTRPSSLGEAKLRVKRNLNLFHVNYFNIVLSAVFLSIIWHPISVIVLQVALIPWFFLYFYRKQPLVLFGRTIDDRAVEAVLSAATFVALGLTGMWVNVLVSIPVGVALVVLHAAFRSTEDLYVDEHEGYNGGLLSSTQRTALQGIAATGLIISSIL